VSLARVAMMDGRLHDAMEHLSDADAVVKGSPFAELPRPYVVTMRGRVQLERGPVAAARTALLSERENGCLAAELVLAELDLAADDPRSAVERLTPVVGRTPLFDLRAEMRVVLAVAHRRPGGGGRRPGRRGRGAAGGGGDGLRPGVPGAAPGPRRAVRPAGRHRAARVVPPAAGRAIRALVDERPEPVEGEDEGGDPGLSERETGVLQYLPGPLTHREIANEMCVSVNTVKTHLRQVYMKLVAADRADAVRRARALGLLGGPGHRSL